MAIEGSELTLTLNGRVRRLTGWKAAVLLWTPVLAAVFCFVVGVVTVLGWLL